MKAPMIWRPYVAGVLHGDGYLTRRAIGLQVKDRDFAAAFAQALSIGFGIPIRVGDTGRYARVRAGNRSGRFDGLKDFKPTNDAERCNWLRGLFDSEGNAQFTPASKMGPRSFSRRIAMYSTEMTTLTKASAMCDALGISHMIRTTTNSASHLGTKTVYELRMTRREGFERFADLVGSNIARKNETMTRIVQTYLDRSAVAREGQMKGAATRSRRRTEVTLPQVVSGVRKLIEAGIKPTQRNCHAIPGYFAIQRHHSQASLVSMALEGTS